MDFTREPVVETVITPRDGYRIVVRSSKNPGQEEYVVEALEVITFGHACFFRHLERPKAFLVPASDFEVFEVREPRLALKAASFEGAVRTTTVRESAKPLPKEIEKREESFDVKEPSFDGGSMEEEVKEESSEVAGTPAPVTDGRQERRREKRRNLRRRKGRDEHESKPEKGSESSKVENTKPQGDKEVVAIPVMTNILPPPTTLIRDNLQKLREVEQRGAIYLQAEGSPKEEREEDDDDAPVVPLSLQEEPLVNMPEENLYKATPAPTDDESQPSLWVGGFAPSSTEKR